MEIGSLVIPIPRPRSSGCVTLKLMFEFSCGLNVEKLLLLELLTSLKNIP